MPIEAMNDARHSMIPPFAMRGIMMLQLSVLAVSVTVTEPSLAMDSRRCPDASAAATSLVESLEGVRCLLATSKTAEAFVRLQQIVIEHPEDAEAQSLLQTTFESLAGRGDLGPDSGTGSEAGSVLPVSEQTHHRVRWLALSAGLDSNINSANSQEVVAIPLLNYRSLALDPLLVERSSPFLGLEAGFVAEQAISAMTSVSVSATASLRVNTSVPSYFPHYYEITGSIAHRIGAFVIGASVGHEQQWIAGHRSLREWSLSTSLRRNLGGRRYLHVFGTVGMRSYPLFLGVMTADSRAGIAFSDSTFGLSGAIQIGTERSTGSIKSLDRRYRGFNVTWDHEISADRRITFQVSQTHSDYAEASELFATSRAERARSFVAAYELAFSGQWTLIPRLALNENVSTIPLANVRRKQLLVTLAKDF